MNLKRFSKKQLRVLTWWCEGSPDCNNNSIICDGAVRSGKTLCMSISFVMWAFYRFNESSFAICSKTIRSVRRNVIVPLIPVMREMGFDVKEKYSENYVDFWIDKRHNRFYLFGGKDESSAALIQGMTLSGIFLDEVALMPRSFVEQALARCSVDGSKFFFNCNPEYPQHWFRQEWILKQQEKKVLYIHFKMEDNPSLSKEVLERYKGLYSGPFYQRFVEGKWIAASGTVYPFMSDDKEFCNVPDQKAEKYIISCDYGTVNPSSFGLWGLIDGVWYRLKEYYYDSRAAGFQKTDEEHYSGLCELAGDKTIEKVIVDPSAASFIQTIRRHGKFIVCPADNRVIDGIRCVSTALRSCKIKICNTCKDSMREFGLYRWDNSGVKDCPIKENDHAMDDIRYFVTSVIENSDDGFFALVAYR